MPSARWWPVGLGLMLGLAAVAMLQPPAWAAGPGSVHDKFLSGSSVVIPAGETVPHDLYVVGSSIHVDGHIAGDLFVAGGTIDINGPVDGDLFVAGGNVTVSSAVGRHLRVAGGNVAVNGPVRLDLMAAAGSLALGPAAQVGGDLIFGAGPTTMGGSVDGDVLGSAQTYSDAGTVGGAEEVTLSRQRPKRSPSPTVAGLLVSQLERYLGIVLLGALLLGLAPRLSESVVAGLRQRPLPSLGWGALGFVGFFAVLIGLLLGMAIVAVPLGIVGLGRLSLAVVLGVLLSSAALSYLFLLVVLFLAAIVVGVTLGELALRGLHQPWAAGRYPALLVGVLLVGIVTAVPILGGLVNAAVVLLGLGALLIRVGSRPNPPSLAPAGAGPVRSAQGPLDPD
jgi:hypothetical protein